MLLDDSATVGYLETQADLDAVSAALQVVRDGCGHALNARIVSTLTGGKHIYRIGIDPVGLDAVGRATLRFRVTVAMIQARQSGAFVVWPA